MVKLTLVGGPTAVVEYAGLRWLTDPSLSTSTTATTATRPAASLALAGYYKKLLATREKHAQGVALPVVYTPLV